jgi:hypothetical protein
VKTKTLHSNLTAVTTPALEVTCWKTAIFGIEKNAQQVKMEDNFNSETLVYYCTATTAVLPLLLLLLLQCYHYCNTKSACINQPNNTKCDGRRAYSDTQETVNGSGQS